MPHPESDGQRGRGLPDGLVRVPFPVAGHEIRHRWLLWRDHEGAGVGRAPVVLCLHGRAEGAIAFARTTRIAPAAAAAGFAVAIPQGRGLVADWNLEHDRPALARLTADLVGDGATKRPVVVVGMSRGAELAAALVLDHPDQVAGFAAVAGVPGPRPSGLVHARPRLVVHGDRDEVVPGALMSADVEGAARAQGCGPAVLVAEDASATTIRYPHPAGADITAVTLRGGGHTWPGAAEPQPRRFGPVVAWPATEAVIDFARRCLTGPYG